MSIANVLLRGLGAGAQSYGASTFQQQEQRRREEAAEQMRVRQMEEQGEQRRLLEADRAAERERQAAESAALAKSLGLKVPSDTAVTPDGVRLLLGKQQYDRQMKSIDGQNLRTKMTNANRVEVTGMNNTARQPLLESQVNVNNARVPQIEAMTRNTNARTGQVGRTGGGVRGGTPDDEQEYQRSLRSIAQKLMQGDGEDNFGALPPDEAMRRARGQADALFGRTPTPTEPPPARGTNLLRGLGVGGGGGEMESEFPGQAAKIQQARRAGYSEEEIRAFLRGGR